MVVRARVRRERATRSTPSADGHHQQPGDQRQPRVEVLGQHVLRQRSVTRPSANTPIVCVTVTVAPSATACRARAARADQVGGDHRLAVARRERVQRAPAERGQQQQHEQHAAARAASANRPAKPSPARSRRGARPPRGAVGRDHACRRPGATAKRRRALVERARQQVLRVAAQAVRRVAARGRSSAPPCPSPGRATIAFQPTRPGKVPSRSSTRARVAHARAQRQLDPRRLQPALRRRGKREPRRPGRRAARPRRPSTVSTRPRCDLRALARRAPRRGEAALLERRDLGLVEHVAHVDAVGRDAHRPSGG